MKTKTERRFYVRRNPDNRTQFIVAEQINGRDVRVKGTPSYPLYNSAWRRAERLDKQAQQHEIHHSA